MFARLSTEPFGAAAALGHAEKAGVGQLAAGRVLADALACLLRVALDIEQIIDDLKRQAETAAIGVESFEQFRRRRTVAVSVSRQRSQTQARPDQGAGLAQVQMLQSFKVSVRLACSQARSSTWPPTMPAAPAARASSRQQADAVRAG